jgi:hypothetical protein
MITRVVRRDGASAVVEIAGEIDVHTSGELRTTLLALADKGHVHLVADFAAVRRTAGRSVWPACARRSAASWRSPGSTSSSVPAAVPVKPSRADGRGALRVA